MMQFTNSNEKSRYLNYKKKKKHDNKFYHKLISEFLSNLKYFLVIWNRTSRLH